MHRKIIYLHTAHCPHLNSDNSITIDYAEIPIMGRMTPGYKILGYQCDDSVNCPESFKDKYGRCPVFLSAPEEPR